MFKNFSGRSLLPQKTLRTRISPLVLSAGTENPAETGVYCCENVFPCGEKEFLNPVFCFQEMLPCRLELYDIFRRGLIHYKRRIFYKWMIQHLAPITGLYARLFTCATGVRHACEHSLTRQAFKPVRGTTDSLLTTTLCSFFS